MIDVHCHLPKDTFTENIEKWIENWTNTGIKAVCSVAMDVEESKISLELAKKHRIVLAGVGIHPWNVEQTSRSKIPQLSEEIADSATLIGEIGLDYYFIKDEERYPYQRDVFNHMLDLANQLDKPVTIHSKGAEKHILDMINRSGISPELTSIHWYSGPDKYLREMIKLGIRFSITPAVFYSRHKRVVELVPIDQLMVESDGDVNYQGQLGHPGLIPSVISKIAEIKGLEVRETNNIINHTTKKFLHL